MAQERPNLLFIMTDEQRYDSLGCYGNPVLRTPHIDSLARDGVRYERCYVQNPMCMPSRMAIMTGRYCSEHGCNINCTGLPPHEQEQTFIRHLRNGGYYTAAIGKMHMMPKWGPFGFSYLDLVEGQADRNNQYTDYLETMGWAGKQHAAKGDKALPEMGGGVYTAALPADETIDAFVGRRAVRWLESYDRDEPFCLWVSFSNPHFPFDPPEPYDTLYDPNEVPLPAWRAGELAGKPAQLRLSQERSFDAVTEAQIRRMVAHYYGTISLIDDQVGQLLRLLESRGWLDDTLIAFTSDHGDLLGDHRLLLKSGVTFYDSCVRVPLLIRYPRRFSAGTTFAEPVETIDLPATFLDVAGVRAPETMQGRSLVSLAEGRVADWREDAYSEIDLRINPKMHGPHDPAVRDYIAMICTRDWKYVHWPNRGLGELYHLASDPHELTNLFDDPAHAGKLAEMRLRLLNRLMNNQRPYIGERTETFREHYDADHRPPLGVIVDAEYAPPELPRVL